MGGIFFNAPYYTYFTHSNQVPINKIRTSFNTEQEIKKIITLIKIIGSESDRNRLDQFKTSSNQAQDIDEFIKLVEVIGNELDCKKLDLLRQINNWDLDQYQFNEKFGNTLGINITQKEFEDLSQIFKYSFNNYIFVISNKSLSEIFILYAEIIQEKLREKINYLADHWKQVFKKYYPNLIIIDHNENYNIRLDQIIAVFQTLPEILKVISATKLLSIEQEDNISNLFSYFDSTFWENIDNNINILTLIIVILTVKRGGNSEQKNNQINSIKNDIERIFIYLKETIMSQNNSQNNSGNNRKNNNLKVKEEAQYIELKINLRKKELEEESWKITNSQIFNLLKMIRKLAGGGFNYKSSYETKETITLYLNSLPSVFNKLKSLKKEVEIIKNINFINVEEVKSIVANHLGTTKIKNIIPQKESSFILKYIDRFLNNTTATITGSWTKESDCFYLAAEGNYLLMRDARRFRDNIQEETLNINTYISFGDFN